MIWQGERVAAGFFGKLKKFNWLMFGAMISLIAIGTIAIWSSGNARAEAIFHDKWISNVVTALFGLLL